MQNDQKQPAKASAHFADGITRVRIRSDRDGWPVFSAGCPDGILLIAGESGEQRAFRRFPVSSHKPG